MGMPMTKSSLAERTQERLQEILYEDILNTGDAGIDQIKVLKDLALFEKEIYSHIMNGGKDYFKPVTVKSIDNYDDPMRIVGIKGTMVFNALKDDNMDPLDLTSRNGLDLVKIDINPDNVEDIRETHPDKYAKCQELFKIKQFSNGIDVIGLPLNEHLPDWILEYVDLNKIINANLKNFPLESIGISKMDKNMVNYSNIMIL